MNEQDILITNKEAKRKKRNKYLLISVISLLVSLLLAFFALRWQDAYTLMAFCNAFYFSGFIFFFIGWMVLMSNSNILSPVIYGLKNFFQVIFTKRAKADYYGYLKEREENPFPKIYYVVPFLACIPNFIVAIILHIML